MPTASAMPPAIAAGSTTARSANRRAPSQRLRGRRQHAEIERAARRSGIALELHGRPAPIAAVERRVFDPLPQLAMAAQRAPDRQAEIPGIGAIKTPRVVARFAARAAVAVDEANPRRAHLPGLLQDARQRRTFDVARMVAVQIDLHACERRAVRRRGGIRELLLSHERSDCRAANRRRRESSLILRTLAWQGHVAAA